MARIKSTSFKSHAYFWYLPNLCNKIGLIFTMIGVFVLISKVALLFLKTGKSSGIAVGIGLTFGFSAVALFIIFAWQALVAIQKLQDRAIPFLEITVNQVTWQPKIGLERYIVNVSELERVDYVNQSSNGVTVKNLKLYLKSVAVPNHGEQVRDGYLEINVSDGRGDFEHAAKLINDLINGAPFQRVSTVYKPNSFSLKERIFNIFASLFLIIYLSSGLWIDDIYLPGKRGGGIHFHGLEAIVLAFAGLMLCANLLLIVVDHYDKRNNEEMYERFSCITIFAAWMLFFVASFQLFFLS